MRGVYRMRDWYMGSGCFVRCLVGRVNLWRLRRVHYGRSETIAKLRANVH